MWALQVAAGSREVAVDWRSSAHPRRALETISVTASKYSLIDWYLAFIFFFVMSFSRSRYCMFLSFSAMAPKAKEARRSTSTSNSTKHSISYASMDIFFVVKFLLRLVFCFFIFFLFNNAIKFGFFEWTRQMHYFRLQSWKIVRRRCSTCYMASLYTTVGNIKRCWCVFFVVANLNNDFPFIFSRLLANATPLCFQAHRRRPGIT